MKTLIIVDNDEKNLQFLEGILHPEGYTTVRARDGKSALQLLDDKGIDLALIAAIMPGMSGFDVTKCIKQRRDIPVILLTGLREREDIVAGLACGADEILSKPFLKEELLLKLNNILTLKSYERAFGEISASRAQCLKDILKRSAKLNREVIVRLLAAVEHKNDETEHHLVRVARYSKSIAEDLGYKGEFLDLLESAAPLHDIGKIGIPDRILLKPGRLTFREFELMKTHAVIGASILEGSTVSLLTLAREIALCHHERWDGTGYPEGIGGYKIPIAARIVALADVFDALTSARPYKPAYGWDKSLIIIKDERGKHFDPGVVDAFLTRIHEISAVHRQYRNGQPAIGATDGVEKFR